MSDESAIHSAIVSGTGLAADRVKWSDQGGARPASPAAWVSLRDLGEAPIGHDTARYVRNPFTFTAKAITLVVPGAPGTVTVPAHGLSSGDGPVRLTTTGTLPGGTAADVDYWAIRVTADTLRLAPSFLAAIDASAPIAIIDTGVGAHAIVSTTQTLKAGAEAKAVVEGVRQRTISVQCFGGDAIGDGSPMGILRRLRAALALPTIRDALHAGGVGLLRANDARNVSLAVSPSVFEPRAVMELVFVVRAPDPNVTETIIETVTTNVTITA